MIHLFFLADLKKYKKFSDSSYEAYFIYREDNDAADVATLNVETVQAFVLRTKLVDAAQQIVIRSLTANSKNGVKPATDRLNTLSDKLKVGNEGASVKPLDMWDRLKDFPEVIDQAASRKEIENAAGDGKLEAAKIQAGFGVEAGQVENTFLITPLVLSLTQTLSLLNDILSKAAADAHPEDFVTKLKFTISNPKKVNEPLLTLAQLRRAKDDLERNPGEYAHLSITTSAAASLPLVAELKKARAAQLGQGQRGQKRKRAPKFVNYRKVFYLFLSFLKPRRVEEKNFRLPKPTLALVAALRMKRTTKMAILMPWILTRSSREWMMLQRSAI